MYRDFTYIDDIIEAMKAILLTSPVEDENGVKYKIYNIGNNHPEKLTNLVSILEEYLEKQAQVELLPMQPGDVYQTYADVETLQKDFGIKPTTSLKQGLLLFIEWYHTYYL